MTAVVDDELLAPGSFSGLVLIRTIGKRQWRLEETLAYRTRAGRTIIVPAGFVSDGASVPRVAWWLYPPFGDDYDRAAIVHDYLYAYAEAFEGRDDGRLSRGEADAIFLEAMAVDGFRASGRRVVYSAVRVGGWRPWREYRKRAVSVARL